MKGPPSKKQKAADRAQLTLTMKMVNSICKILEDGCFRVVAAQHEGVTRHMLNRWILVGKKQLKEYDEGERHWTDVDTRGILVKKMGIAESSFERRAVTRIIKEGSPADIIRFLQLTKNRRYNTNPLAIEDPETAEVTRIDTKALLKEKMAFLMTGEEEPEDE